MISEDVMVDSSKKSTQSSSTSYKEIVSEDVEAVLMEELEFLLMERSLSEVRGGESPFPQRPSQEAFVGDGERNNLEEDVVAFAGRYLLMNSGWELGLSIII